MENMKILLAIINKTFLNAWLVKLCGAIVVTFLATKEYFLPISTFLKLTAVLVTADWITGILASVINNVPLTSTRMKRTVIKITGYSIALIVAHEITISLLPGFEAAFFATFYIASTELKSLDENMEKLFGVSILGYLSKKIDENKPKSNGQ